MQTQEPTDKPTKNKTKQTKNKQTNKNTHTHTKTNQSYKKIQTAAEQNETTEKMTGNWTGRQRRTAGDGQQKPSHTHLCKWPHWDVVCRLLNRPSNILVCLRDRSARTILRAATLRQKLQTELSISPSHSILTSPSTDPVTPGAWQGRDWSANFQVTGMTRTRKNPGASGIRTRDLPLSRRTP